MSDTLEYDALFDDEAPDLVMANSSITTFLRDMQNKNKLQPAYRAVVGGRGPTYMKHADSTFLKGTDDKVQTHAFMVGALHRLYQMWETRLSWVSAEDFVKYFQDTGVVHNVVDMTEYRVKDGHPLHDLMPNESFRKYELLCPTVMPAKHITELLTLLKDWNYSDAVRLQPQGALTYVPTEVNVEAMKERRARNRLVKKEGAGVSEDPPISDDGDSASIARVVGASPATPPGLGGETPKRKNEEPPCDQPLAKRRPLTEAVYTMIPFDVIKNEVLATLKERGKSTGLLESLSAVPLKLSREMQREVLHALCLECDDTLCNTFVEAMTTAVQRELLS